MSAPVETAALRRTPLFSLHRELGAKLIDFGGWEMPVQYTGILEEHRAVRERAGIFDVSHMGELEVRGPGALGALQKITPNDVSRLEDGRCHYSAFLTERGTFVDDLLVYRRAADDFLVVVNASNTPKDYEWAARESARRPRSRTAATTTPFSPSRGRSRRAWSSGPRERIRATSPTTRSGTCACSALRRSCPGPATRARTASSCTSRPATPSA